MTTAFQTIFDNATSISINKRKKVAQTISRDGTVRATNFGGQIWQFNVELPSGPRYSVYRPLIEKIEALDRVTVGQVQIKQPGQLYISGYQGDLTNISGVTVSYTSGNTVSITGGATLASGYRFKAGDFIQLGNNSVYSVTADVLYNQSVITLNRPVRENAGSYTLKIGQNVVWDVICVSFPEWTIFGYDQVSWSGPFVFAEAL